VRTGLVLENGEGRVEAGPGASLLVEMGEPEAIRKEVMGHSTSRRRSGIGHLRPVHEIPAHERLVAIQIADLVTASRKRASGKPVGKKCWDSLRAS
jgi:hypothetical protein